MLRHFREGDKLLKDLRSEVFKCYCLLIKGSKLKTKAQVRLKLEGSLIERFCAKIIRLLFIHIVRTQITSVLLGKTTDYLWEETLLQKNRNYNTSNKYLNKFHAAVSGYTRGKNGARGEGAEEGLSKL